MRTRRITTVGLSPGGWSMFEPAPARMARMAHRADRQRPRPGGPARAIGLAAAVYAFWLVISGSLAQHDLAIGLVVAMILGLWAERSLWAGEPPMLGLRRLPPLLGYLAGLAGHIVRAAAHVARIVFDPRLPIEPTIISHRVALRQPLARLVFAQSVTLMPGTATVDVQGDTFLIHCLDRGSAELIRSGELERRIAGVFSGAPET
jgi:multicomponent Na+:H+ antiporter subunit E